MQLLLVGKFWKIWLGPSLPVPVFFTLPFLSLPFFLWCGLAMHRGWAAYSLDSLRGESIG